MKTNIEFYNISRDNLEKVTDPNYFQGLMVIPPDKNIKNELTLNNEKLIDLITTYSCLYTKTDKHSQIVINDIVKDIIFILDNTEHINFSAFAQFFMVYCLSHSVYKKLSDINKKTFIIEMLNKYCEDRHKIYKSFGYSNIVLQVMSDNYSHKRYGKKGIDKILNILEPCELSVLNDINEFKNSDNYYFLPDKGGNIIFEEFINEFNIALRNKNKLPDIVFKYNGQYYICELKYMKESGGGQDKQLLELCDFIKNTTVNNKYHFISFFDGIYFNEFIISNRPKIKKQRNDFERTLKNNTQNYFLNTYGFKEFVNDLLND